MTSGTGRNELDTTRCPDLNRRSPCASSAFTYVEVMVAVVLLSIGIVTILEGYQVAATALRVSRQTILADAALREAVEEIASSGLSSEILAIETIGPKGDGYGVTVDYAFLSVVGDRHLYKVNLEAVVPNSDREFRLDTYMTLSRLYE
jgi:type II secretory pathway pseudopilin PulG